jgi:hypothetical protein
MSITPERTPRCRLRTNRISEFHRIDRIRCGSDRGLASRIDLPGGQP